MASSNSSVHRQIAVEAKIGLVVFLLLFGCLSFLIISRLASQLPATDDDFSGVPLAQVIPAEDLARVRQPDYKLPARRETQIAQATNTEKARRDDPLVRPSLKPGVSPPSVDDQVASSIETRISTDKTQSELALAGHMETDTKPQGTAAKGRPDPERVPSSRKTQQDPPKVDVPTNAQPSRLNSAEQRTPTLSQLKEKLEAPAQEERPQTLEVSNRGEFEPRSSESFSTKAEPSALPSAPPTEFQATFPEFGQRLPDPLHQTRLEVEPESSSKGSTADELRPSPPDNTQDLGKDDVEWLEVAPGETLWDIATRHYGDGRLFQALYEANQPALRGKTTLVAGSRLAAPSKKNLFAKYSRSIPADLLAEAGEPPSPQAAGTYVTQSGDSLFSIAREQLGQASRFAEIQELNRQRLPSGANHLDSLPEGLRLQLPLKPTQGD